MNRLKTYCISAVIILLALTVSTAFASNRIALVIGNSNYQSAPLKNPVNDAHDMQKILQKLGFKVFVETDANKRAINKALDEFSKTIKKGDVALFFYAGHGVQVEGINYLLPMGCNINRISDIEYEALPVGKLLGAMEEAQSINIVMLDACRNNPLGRVFSRSLSRGLAVIPRKPEGSFIAYATAPGRTAADGDGRNGLFTSALLKHMETPKVEIQTLFTRIRADVKQKSSGSQIPWTESSLTSEFYFVSEGAFQLDNNNLQAKRDRIIRERKEFEKLKAEIAERKRLEQEHRRLEAEKKLLLQKKPVKTVAIDPAVQQPKIIDRDGHYVKYENGIIYDVNKGLMWASKDNGKDIDWYNANKYCENYRKGGFTDWRLPSQHELAGLYEKGTTNTNPSIQGCQGNYPINRLFHITCSSLWSTKLNDSVSTLFFFYNGSRHKTNMSQKFGYRILPVRDCK